MHKSVFLFGSLILASPAFAQDWQTQGLTLEGAPKQTIFQGETESALPVARAELNISTKKAGLGEPRTDLTGRIPTILTASYERNTLLGINSSVRGGVGIASKTWGRGIDTVSASQRVVLEAGVLNRDLGRIFFNLPNGEIDSNPNHGSPTLPVAQLNASGALEYCPVRFGREDLLSVTMSSDGTILGESKTKSQPQYGICVGAEARGVAGFPNLSMELGGGAYFLARIADDTRLKVGPTVRQSYNHDVNKDIAKGSSAATGLFSIRIE